MGWVCIFFNQNGAIAWVLLGRHELSASYPFRKDKPRWDVCDEDSFQHTSWISDLSHLLEHLFHSTGFNSAWDWWSLDHHLVDCLLVYFWGCCRSKEGCYLRSCLHFGSLLLFEIDQGWLLLVQRWPCENSSSYWNLCLNRNSNLSLCVLWFPWDQEI